MVGTPRSGLNHIVSHDDPTTSEEAHSYTIAKVSKSSIRLTLSNDRKIVHGDFSAVALLRILSEGRYERKTLSAKNASLTVSPERFSDGVILELRDNVEMHSLILVAQDEKKIRTEVYVAKSS